MNTPNKTNFSNQRQNELNLSKNFMLELDEDDLVVLSIDHVAKAETMIKTDSSYTIHSDNNHNNDKSEVLKIKTSLFV